VRDETVNLPSSVAQYDAVREIRIEEAEERRGKLGIPRAYGSYEELLQDPEIEAV